MIFKNNILEMQKMIKALVYKRKYLASNIEWLRILWKISKGKIPE